MPFAIENLRLKELAIVADLNKPIFDHFVRFLARNGYSSLHAFIVDKQEARAGAAILAFLEEPLPDGICLHDGIARPYAPDKGRWLLLGWILRDAPEQRLRPMVSSMPGNSAQERQATILNRVRAYVGDIFPDPHKWDWNTISEVIVDRLEGSRRAIKGTLFEAIVRRRLGHRLIKAYPNSD